MRWTRCVWRSHWLSTLFAEPLALCSQVGLTPAQRKDFDTFVSAVPCVSLHAFCETEVCAARALFCSGASALTASRLCPQGEEGSDILENDITTCNVHVCLERLGAAGACGRGKAPWGWLLTRFLCNARCVTAATQTPFFPGSKEEGWWVLLADVSSNALLAAQKVRSLPCLAARYVCAYISTIAHGDIAGHTDDAEVPQQVPCRSAVAVSSVCWQRRLCPPWW